MAAQGGERQGKREADRTPEAGRLKTFVLPRPNKTLIRLAEPLNRLLMLKGIPFLRDVPGLRRVPGIRGLTDVGEIDWPAEDESRLASVCGEGRATFIVPNHPEFFTDWMIDKEIISRVAPMAASWATNAVVNGLGAAMQRFWLASNLVAQIPGNSEPARSHSVDWALRGHGVLLHPEGAVGWHADWIAPLMPGAAQMAAAALEQRPAPSHRVFLAPVVWKLVFLEDVDRALHQECTYVERRLGLKDGQAGATPASRIHDVYGALLARDAAALGMTARGPTFRARHENLLADLCRRLSQALDAQPGGNAADLLRAARRQLRDGSLAPSTRGEVSGLADRLERAGRMGAFAWASPTMSQEQAAEHLKRLRSDYCKRTVRDTLGRFLPQPVGRRRVVIRVPEPIEVLPGDTDAGKLTLMLRTRLQSALDAINARLQADRVFRRTYPNPFHA